MNWLYYHKLNFSKNMSFDNITWKLNCPYYHEMNTQIYRSNHRRCFFLKKKFLRNFANFTRKHLCQSLVFNKVAGLEVCNFNKKRIWHRYFPVNFANFLRRSFFTEHPMTTASGFNEVTWIFVLLLLSQAKIFAKIRQFWRCHLKTETTPIITIWSVNKNKTIQYIRFKTWPSPIITSWNFHKNILCI